MVRAKNSVAKGTWSTKELRLQKKGWEGEKVPEKRAANYEKEGTCSLGVRKKEACPTVRGGEGKKQTISGGRERRTLNQPLKEEDCAARKTENGKQKRREDAS